jgi:RHS repeat-associated protein
VRNWLIAGAEQVLTYPQPAVKLLNGTTPAAATYMHRDALGSVRASTSAAGAKIEAAVYKPFGEQSEWVTPGNAAPETKGWIGERYDADAGLQYLNARYYDPALGMFLQPDWFEVTKVGVGTNRFSYCGGDPVNCSDANGNVPDNWATKDNKKGYDSNGYTHEYSEKYRQSEVTKYRSWNDTNHPHYKDRMDENGPGEPGLFGSVYGPGGDMGVEIDYPTGWGETSVKYQYPDSVYDYSFGGSGQAASGDAIFDLVTLGGTAALRWGIRATTTTADTVMGATVYRVYGGKATLTGRSWTRVDPRTTLNYRSAAGLPDQNTGTHLAMGKVVDGTGVQTRSALPLDGNPGGLDEVLVPDPANQIRILDVFELDRPF